LDTKGGLPLGDKEGQGVKLAILLFLVPRSRRMELNLHSPIGIVLRFIYTNAGEEQRV
jgi:hypothetical protein